LKYTVSAAIIQKFVYLPMTLSNQMTLP